MAINGISTFESEDYISQSDKAKNEGDGATIFVLGALDVDVRAALADRSFGMKADGSFTANRNQNALDAVKYGLRNWKNFKDSKGKDIKFETTQGMFAGKTLPTVKDECLRVLPSAIILELGNKILSLNSVSEELEKNLKTGQ